MGHWILKGEIEEDNVSEAVFTSNGVKNLMESYFNKRLRDNNSMKIVSEILKYMH